MSVKSFNLGEQLTPQDYQDWKARLRFAHEYHKKELVPKYRVAKKRFNSEVGYVKTNRMATKHDDINFLYKSIRNFVGSIYFQNPEIDFTARGDDPQIRRNIENLEQEVNDDIKDSSEFKMMIRSGLIDESLAGLGAVYIDYDYRDRVATDEFGQPIPAQMQPVLDEYGQQVGEQPVTDEQGNPLLRKQIIKNEVCFYKIRPENVLRPPYQQFYNHKSGPYLGYVDVVSLDDLRRDGSLDQNVVGMLKGKEYKDLVDKDLYDKTQEGKSEKDLMFVKVYYAFIRDVDAQVMRRLVIADAEDTKDQPLGFSVWDKGHGKDGLGYPVHILELDDCCDSFIPPSEAWRLESVMKVIDYVYQKIVRHIRKSATRTFVKTGQGGFNKAEVDKIAKNIDQEVIGVNDLPAGIPVGNIVHQVVDQMLSQDHSNLFLLCKQMFDELSRQPSFSKAEVINKDKTAAESQLIQQSDNTVNGDYIDKFRDFLKGLFTDWALLKQANMQGVKRTKVLNKDTGEEEDREYTRDGLLGDFNADVNVESMMMPNKEVKRMIAKQTLSDLVNMKAMIDQSGYILNLKKVIDMYVENIGMRDSEDLLMPKPVRSIEKQVVDLATKNIPMNPQELGDHATELQNGMNLFSDDQLMQGLANLNPEVMNPQGQLVQTLQFLGQSAEEGKKKQPISKAKTDVGMNAAIAGQASK